MTRVEALDVAVFPGVAALDIGGIGVDSPRFPHGLGQNRAPIPSSAVQNRPGSWFESSLAYDRKTKRLFSFCYLQGEGAFPFR